MTRLHLVAGLDPRDMFENRPNLSVKVLRGTTYENTDLVRVSKVFYALA